MTSPTGLTSILSLPLGPRALFPSSAMSFAAVMLLRHAYRPLVSVVPSFRTRIDTCCCSGPEDIASLGSGIFLLSFYPFCWFFYIEEQRLKNILLPGLFVTLADISNMKWSVNVASSAHLTTANNNGLFLPGQWRYCSQFSRHKDTFRINNLESAKNILSSLCTLLA